MSFIHETDMSQQEILFQASSHLKAVGYRVKTKGYILETASGRDCSALVLFSLFLLIFGPFLIYWFSGYFFYFTSILVSVGSFLLGSVLLLIYWFTRPKNQVIIDTSTLGRFEIQYEGPKAANEAERLARMFKK